MSIPEKLSPLVHDFICHKSDYVYEVDARYFDILMMMIHTKHHKKEENAIIAQLAEFTFGKFLCVKKVYEYETF